MELNKSNKFTLIKLIIVSIVFMPFAYLAIKYNPSMFFDFESAPMTRILTHFLGKIFLIVLTVLFLAKLNQIDLKKAPIKASYDYKRATMIYKTSSGFLISAIMAYGCITTTAIRNLFKMDITWFELDPFIAGLIVIPFIITILNSITRYWDLYKPYWYVENKNKSYPIVVMILSCIAYIGGIYLSLLFGTIVFAEIINVIFFKNSGDWLIQMVAISLVANIIASYLKSKISVDLRPRKPWQIISRHTVSPDSAFHKWISKPLSFHKKREGDR